MIKKYLHLAIALLAPAPFVYGLLHLYVTVEKWSSEENAVNLLKAQTTARYASSEKSDPLYCSTHMPFLEEGDLFQSGEWQKVEEAHTQPLELNGEELKQLLSTLEGVAIPPYSPPEGKPQLFVRDFELSKKLISPQKQAYVVSLKLLKREPVSHD